MSKFSSLLKGLKSKATKHSPEILIGVGIAGMVMSVVLAVKATPKAVELIEETKYKKDVDELSKIDTVKAAWKCYIPTAVTCILSATCILGGSDVNIKRNMALATAYTLSESALKDYQKKVIETIGENEEAKIKDEILKDKVKQHPINNNQDVMITSTEDVLCFDAVTGRYFRSDKNKIDKAVNDLNRNMRDELYISLNDFYYEISKEAAIGLDSVSKGDNFGWDIERGYIELDYSSQLTNRGIPCIVIDYDFIPLYYRD